MELTPNIECDIIIISQGGNRMEQYGYELLKKMNRIHKLNVVYNPADFEECKDKIDVQCVVDDLIDNAREQRYRLSWQFPKVNKFVISTGMERSEWICVVGEKTYFGVYNEEYGFSTIDVKQMAECINALVYMGYEINTEVINKIIKNHYCGYFVGMDNPWRWSSVENLALEYLGVA